MPPKKGKRKKKRKKITKQKGRCTSVPLRCGRVGNLEPLWREVLEGGSRASAPKVSRAQEGKLTIRLAKVPLVDRPAFSIKPLAEYLGPVLIGTKSSPPTK